ncbi:unnamed protein product [Blepharisma stoltei]|uniref:Uncharacterized protein n=1 Tax=Blepharisma stoltei TaxID=1481888 RepID=A0AAU9JH20_9CILI|nr:unnamed protein product [Blepharisma stoltei]
MAEIGNPYILSSSELALPKPKNYYSSLKKSCNQSISLTKDDTDGKRLLEEINSILQKGEKFEKELIKQDPLSSHRKIKNLIAQRASNPIIKDEFFKEFDTQASC